MIALSWGTSSSEQYFEIIATFLGEKNIKYYYPPANMYYYFEETQYAIFELELLWAI